MGLICVALKDRKVHLKVYLLFSCGKSKRSFGGNADATRRKPSVCLVFNVVQAVLKWSKG